MKSGCRQHETDLKHVLTFPFFQNTTAYDVEQVDIALAQNMAVLIICVSWAVAGQAVMISIVPYMAIVNGGVFVVYFLMLRYYRGAGADLQRLDAVSRSPIAASLSESLDGTTTINAFDATLLSLTTKCSTKVCVACHTRNWNSYTEICLQIMLSLMWWKECL